MRDRYGAVLVLLLAAYVLDAFRTEHWIPRILSALLLFGLVVLALVAPDVARPLRILGFTGLGLTVAFLVAAEIASNEDLRGLALIALASVLSVAIASVVHRLTHHPVIDITTVMGAIVTYTLLGFMFGLLFEGIDQLTAEPFFAQGLVEAGDYTYFAFVTLTTLGYGDLAPATELAKRLSVLEALFGQIFMVVLVARLVSLWGRPNPRTAD